VGETHHCRYYFSRLLIRDNHIGRTGFNRLLAILGLDLAGYGGLKSTIVDTVLADCSIQDNHIDRAGFNRLLAILGLDLADFGGLKSTIVDTF